MAAVSAWSSHERALKHIMPIVKALATATTKDAAAILQTASNLTLEVCKCLVCYPLEDQSGTCFKD